MNSRLKVIGYVVNKENGENFGMKGKLQFSISTLYLNDGRTIKLRNSKGGNLKIKNNSTFTIDVSR